MRSYGVGSSVLIPPAGLAVTPDNSTLFAVTTDAFGTNPTLNVIANPGIQPPL